MHNPISQESTPIEAWVIRIALFLDSGLYILNSQAMYASFIYWYSFEYHPYRAALSAISPIFHIIMSIVIFGLALIQCGFRNRATWALAWVPPIIIVCILVPFLFPYGISNPYQIAHALTGFEILTLTSLVTYLSFTKEFKMYHGR